MFKYRREKRKKSNNKSKNLMKKIQNMASGYITSDIQVLPVKSFSSAVSLENEGQTDAQRNINLL